MKNITVSEHEEISVENIYVLDKTDTNNTNWRNSKYRKYIQ